MSTDAAFDEYERAHGVKFSPKMREGMRAAKLEHIGNSRAVAVMLDCFHQLIADLAKLRWRMATLPMGAADLVCSDHPAKFVRVREDGVLQPQTAGWSQPDRGVMMPLSPRLLLLGATDEAVADVFEWKIGNVAVNELNRVIATGARWVYAPEQLAAGIVLASPVPWRTQPSRKAGG